MLDVTGLGEYVDAHFTRRAFRLETLAAYDVATDDNDVGRYLRGEPEPDPARKGPWLERLRSERREGKRRQRVHVVRSPLSDYLRYECEWGYLPNVAAGEDIWILDLAERPVPAGLVDHDFWLLDDEHVIRMHYDGQGRFVGAEILDDAQLPRYRRARDEAIEAAEPFLDYWQRRPEDHRANWSAV